MMLDSAKFVAYVRKRSLFSISKAEWQALFIVCSYDYDVIYDALSGREEWETSQFFSDLSIGKTSFRSLCTKLPTIKKTLEKTESLETSINLEDFQNYIIENGFSFISKSDWTTAFFYFYLKNTNVINNDKNLLSLNAYDVGSFADKFNLLSSQVTPLIKKAYPIAITSDSMRKDFDFIDFLLRGLASDISIINNENIKIEIRNPIALDKFSRILQENNILQDYSFNSYIRVINLNSMKRLVSCIDKKCKKGDLDEVLADFSQSHPSLSKQLKERIEIKTSQDNTPITVVEVLDIVSKIPGIVGISASVVGGLLQLFSKHFGSKPKLI